MQKLPNGTTVLVLGIVSIFGACCCNGIVGVVCGLIALQLYKKDLVLYTANPENYSDFQNLKTGRILAIIGLALGALLFAYFLYQIITLGYQGYMDKVMETYRATGLMK